QEQAVFRPEPHLGELARNSIRRLEHFAKCEPATALDEMDTVTPALGVLDEFGHVMAPRRVLKERDRPVAPPYLGSPREGLRPHNQNNTLVLDNCVLEYWRGRRSGGGPHAPGRARRANARRDAAEDWSEPPHR